jgi:predicted ATP-dependent serine protease
VSNLTEIAAEDIGEAAERLEESDHSGTSSHRERRTTKLKVMTLQELYNAPEEEHRWVVEDLLPMAGSSILHGKPKKGKSTLARQLAVAVSQGQPFLGKATLQGPVLYLALEEKLSEIKGHFRLLGATDTDPIHIIPDCRGHDLHAIREIIVELKPVLVIVDTLGKFINLKKYNDYGPVNESLRHLHDLARDTTTHLLCVHHSKKGAEDDATDNLLGSVALAGAVDTLIALQGTQDRRSISTSQRYGNAMEETALKFDPETRSLSLGNTAKAEAEESKLNTRRILSEQMVEFVINNRGCTEIDVLEGVTGKSEAIKALLRELLKERLRREGKGVAGNPFRYYADVPIEVDNTC